MKLLRKIFLYTGILFVVVTVALLVSAFLFKDKIIQQFIREANKSLSTPITIKKIDVSVFEKFPNLSIVFHDVYIEDSHEGQYPLLEAKTISFQLNPIEVYRGIYTIRGLKTKDTEVYLKINTKGENNYTITKNTTESSGAVTFDLSNIQLINTLVEYKNLQQAQDYIFISNELQAALHSQSGVYNIKASGDVTLQKFQNKQTAWFEGKKVVLKSALQYNDENKSLLIEPSNLLIAGSPFTLKGSYTWKEENQIDLQAEGKNTDIQTIVSLLPQGAISRLNQYKSEGDVYFTATLSGKITKTKNPALSIAFGLRDARLTHPDKKAELNNVSLEGSFATPDITSMRQSALILKNIQGTLQQETFQSNLAIQNLNDPEVVFDFKGILNAQDVFRFYPVDVIENPTGLVNADISFSGKLAWLKSKATAQRAETSGTIDLDNLNFHYGAAKIPVQYLSGNLRFNKNDLALSNVSGIVGQSDFVLNGFFKNIITYILFDNQPVGIEADLHAKRLNLDELFQWGFSSTAKADDYEFRISPNLYLNFNCDVQSVNYKRFHAKNLKGDLLVKNEMAVSREITLHSMGGNLALTGIVDAKNPKAIAVSSAFKLDKVHIDSIFYVFENFGQDFIADKHLKGKAVADVNLEMVLNQNLKLFPETLVADISAVIREGELNNFEPMQSLRKYLDDDGLSQLRFADLKNDIHIENKTVYIPQMEIRSNVTSLQISGTHTFDQQIEYRIATPLLNRKKINLTEAAGAIEDQGGQPKLFLKIVGTTSDYRVIYDTEAVKRKIASDLKKEVQELKDAFKNKGIKKKAVELSEEEFDW